MMYSSVLASVAETAVVNAADDEDDDAAAGAASKNLSQISDDAILAFFLGAPGSLNVS